MAQLQGRHKAGRYTSTIHAATGPGAKALCGIRVAERHVTIMGGEATVRPFNPTHPNACQRCARLASPSR